MATEKLTEQEIQLRKRARRRLVGAVALVLLMVTVLPMVLDDREEQAPQPEIAVSIPSQDGKEFSSSVVPVVPPAAPVAGPASPEPVAPPAAAAQPEAAAEPQPEAAVAVKPVEPQPKAAEPEPKAASAGHAVQIGVFSDSTNVKRVQDKLTSMGYQSYTEKLETEKGSKLRLRVGPFAERAEAEKALVALKAAGLSGIVVSK